MSVWCCVWRNLLFSLSSSPSMSFSSCFAFFLSDICSSFTLLSIPFVSLSAILSLISCNCSIVGSFLSSLYFHIFLECYVSCLFPPFPYSCNCTDGWDCYFSSYAFMISGISVLNTLASYIVCLKCRLSCQILSCQGQFWTVLAQPFLFLCLLLGKCFHGPFCIDPDCSFKCNASLPLY